MKQKNPLNALIILSFSFMLKLCFGIPLEPNTSITGERDQIRLNSYTYLYFEGEDVPRPRAEDALVSDSNETATKVHDGTLYKRQPPNPDNDEDLIWRDRSRLVRHPPRNMPQWIGPRLFRWAARWISQMTPPSTDDGNVAGYYHLAGYTLVIAWMTGPNPPRQWRRFGPRNPEPPYDPAPLNARVQASRDDGLPVIPEGRRNPRVSAASLRQWLSQRLEHCDPSYAYGFVYEENTNANLWYRVWDGHPSSLRGNARTDERSEVSTVDLVGEVDIRSEIEQSNTHNDNDASDGNHSGDSDDSDDSTHTIFVYTASGSSELYELKDLPVLQKIGDNKTSPGQDSQQAPPRPENKTNLIMKQPNPQDSYMEIRNGRPVFRNVNLPPKVDTVELALTYLAILFAGIYLITNL